MCQKNSRKSGWEEKWKLRGREVMFENTVKMPED